MAGSGKYRIELRGELINTGSTQITTGESCPPFARVGHETGVPGRPGFPKVGIALCGFAVIFYSVTAATYWRWLGLF